MQKTLAAEKTVCRNVETLVSRGDANVSGYTVARAGWC